MDHKHLLKHLLFHGALAESYGRSVPQTVTAQEDEGDGSVQCSSKSPGLPFPFSSTFSFKGNYACQVFSCLMFNKGVLTNDGTPKSQISSQEPEV